MSDIAGPPPTTLQLPVLERVISYMADRDLLERAREEIRARVEYLSRW